MGHSHMTAQTTALEVENSVLRAELEATQLDLRTACEDMRTAMTLLETGASKINARSCTSPYKWQSGAKALGGATNAYGCWVTWGQFTNNNSSRNNKYY